MAYGKPICAVCGGTVGVEEHHLYLRADGCPDDLTIWLCYTHHGAAHGLKRRINISERTKAALTVLKAKGKKLGGDRGYRPDGAPVAFVDGPAASAKARSLNAMQAAFAVRAKIEAIRATEGADTSLQALARALTAQGVATPRGGTAWTATAVRRVLARTA